jgi:muconolactone delta-isomerase
MSAAVSGTRVKFGKTDGDLRVTSGGRLVLVGMVAGTLTVESGGYANIIGMVVDELVIEPGAGAKLPGICMGDVTNHGGELTISGTVKGVLRGRSTTRVMPQARIDRFDEPIDPETGEGPLPRAADLTSRVIDDLTNARWAEVRARFDARMHDSLSEEELAAVWLQVPGRFGNYQGHGDTDSARVGDITRTVTRMRFDAGELVARIGFRDDQTIAGLYILDA